MDNLTRTEILLGTVEGAFEDQKSLLKDLDFKTNSGENEENIKRLEEIRDKTTLILKPLREIREESIKERIRIENMKAKKKLTK
ncbi:hypothetical protein KAS79_02680 [Candidatus Parcubacteria bacterium]|nr:hypothetical protein [Candidatus Parcubacteria bacterium]